MRYILAIFIPPLAVLLCKRPFQFVFNLALWLASLPLIFFLGLGILVWLICSVHALLVCRASSIDKRVDRLVQVIEGQRQASPVE